MLFPRSSEIRDTERTHHNNNDDGGDDGDDGATDFKTNAQQNERTEPRVNDSTTTDDHRRPRPSTFVLSAFVDFALITTVLKGVTVYPVND